MSFFTDYALPFHAVAGLLIIAILAAWHDWFQLTCAKKLIQVE